MKEAKHDLTEFDNAMSEFLPHVADRFCPQCGQPVDKNPIGRPRKFCSASCRKRWWSEHPKPEKLEIRTAENLPSLWKGIYICQGSVSSKNLLQQDMRQQRTGQTWMNK